MPSWWGSGPLVDPGCCFARVFCRTLWAVQRAGEGGRASRPRCSREKADASVAQPLQAMFIASFMSEVAAHPIFLRDARK